ncbi:hypothetical protein [Serratia marcescens]|uniref:hypothetical protein n=1 Tax=Serratia marcescens TaxID=615 RepID=UPI0018D7DC66|nr:hypothetical protein [Serratia marcescens]MBK5605331.1 hypothetical protein [Serratia marcescens]
MSITTHAIVDSSEKERFFLNILRWGIAFFFIATPFNPYVGDVTLYLWIPLVFMDYEFIRKLSTVSLKILLFFCVWTVLCLAFWRYDLVIKTFALVLGVAYIHKIGKPVFSKIYVCMLISVLWCILQFSLYEFAGTNYSAAIGPKAISIAIWGDYATKTFTNQYEVFLLPRMSGLSREAGFFVSLLIISFMIRLRDFKLRTWEIVLFALGYIFSLSKASVILFLIAAVYPFRRILAKIPVVLTFSLFIVVFVSIANYLNVGVPAFFYENQSIAHRFSASYLVLNMNVPSFLIGCGKEYECFTNYQPIVDYLGGFGFKPNVGLLGVAMEMGVIGLIAIIFFCMYLKLDSYDVVILVLFTATVTFFTVDSFIILTYYYIYSNHTKK